MREPKSHLRFWIVTWSLATALLILPVAAEGQAQLVVSGRCPGDMIFTIVDASPSGSLEIYQGTKRGSADVPGGACAGTQTGLSNPQLLATVAADADGSFARPWTLPDSACGLLLQPVDITTCITGNVARVDTAGVPAPVARTGQSNQYVWGDDGTYEKGMPSPHPRFTDNLDGTVKDNLTGLIWLQKANCLGGWGWEIAVEWANGLAVGQCGLTDGSEVGDWRLPNVRELHSLIAVKQDDAVLLPNGHPFSGVSKLSFLGVWSSTTCASANTEAWSVNFVDGEVSTAPKELSPHGGWAVRGGR